MSKTGNNTRFYIYAVALLPFILLLATGVIMLKYHTGASPETTVMGLDGHSWMAYHKLLAILTTPIILLHLFVKTDWVKRLFTLKLKGAFKTSNIILFVIFVLCAFTGFASGKLGGIHNKFGLLLIITFVIHVWNYRKVIVSQFKNLKRSKVVLKEETVKVR